MFEGFSLRKIIAAVDGSPAAWRALDLARALAVREGAEVVLCGVVDRPAVYAASVEVAGVNPAPLLESFEAEVRGTLDEARERLRTYGIAASERFSEGMPLLEIVGAARACGADMIVMGTHGRSGMVRLLLGSIADGVIRSSPVPVLVTNESAELPEDPFARLLIAVDASDPAQAAVEVGIALAKKGRRAAVCTVIDAHALEDPQALAAFEKEEVAAGRRKEGHALISTALLQARNAGVEAEEMIRDGLVAEEILAAAKAFDATTIVLGTHGRRGMEHFFLGSVAGEVVRRSVVPVLVVNARCDR